MQLHKAINPKRNTQVTWAKNVPYAHNWDPHGFSIGYDDSYDQLELPRIGHYLAGTNLSSQYATIRHHSWALYSDESYVVFDMHNPQPAHATLHGVLAMRGVIWGVEVPDMAVGA